MSAQNYTLEADNKINIRQKEANYRVRPTFFEKSIANNCIRWVYPLLLRAYQNMPY